MDDLISRQAVLEATSAKLKITGKENAETVYKYIKKLCDEIKALPSVDTVKVVRCKDCKWYDTRFVVCHNPRFGDGWANYQPPKVREDFFCNDGERKTDG